MEEYSEELEERMETLEKEVQTLKNTVRKMRMSVEEVSVEVRKEKRIWKIEKEIEASNAGSRSEGKSTEIEKIELKITEIISQIDSFLRGSKTSPNPNI